MLLSAKVGKEHADMGIRGELFSSKINCRGRSYFFNVKENRTGDVFLNIVESKPTENAEFDRRSIVVFKEDMREFLQAFEKALRYIDTSPAPKRAKRISRPHSADPEGEKPARRRKVVVKKKQSGDEDGAAKS